MEDSIAVLAPLSPSLTASPRSAIIASGNYSYANSDITEEQFPMKHGRSSRRGPWRRTRALPWSEIR